MDDEPVFDQVNLIVNDMDAAVAFYRLLGATIPDTDDPLIAHHRSVATPGVHLDLDSAAFARRWDTGWTGGEASAVFTFHVSSRQAVDDMMPSSSVPATKASSPRTTPSLVLGSPSFATPITMRWGS